MNRRRPVKSNIGIGAIVLLIAAALVVAGAGVFHAYTKNQQIKVARALQKVENRISQHRFDITNLEVRLEDQLNPILLNDRLIQMSSDLRRIPREAVQNLPAERDPRAVKSRGPESRRATPSLVDLDTP